jgi:hypothetical protein
MAYGTYLSKLIGLVVVLKTAFDDYSKVSLVFSGKVAMSERFEMYGFSNVEKGFSIVNVVIGFVVLVG